MSLPLIFLKCFNIRHVVCWLLFSTENSIWYFGIPELLFPPTLINFAPLKWKCERANAAGLWNAANLVKLSSPFLHGSVDHLSPSLSTRGFAKSQFPLPHRFLNASTSSVTKRNRPATFLDFHSVSQWNMYFVSLSLAVCIIVFLSSSLYLCYCVSFHSIEPKQIVLQILLGRGRGFNWAQLLFSLLLLHLWNLAAVSICAPDTSFPLYLLKRALNPISKRGMTAFYPHCIVTFYIQEIGIFPWVIFFWLHKGIAWIRWFGKDWLQMHFPAIQQRRSFFSKEIQLHPDRSIYLTVTSVCVLLNLIKRECWCFPAKDTLNSMKCSQFPVIHCLLML